MASVIQGQAKLVGVSGSYRSQEFIINKDEYYVGRHAECDLVLKENTISARHSRIQKVEGKYRISDLESTNGTYVNGERVTQSDLRHEDRIQFDVYEFIFLNAEDVSRTIETKLPPDLGQPHKPGVPDVSPAASPAASPIDVTRMIPNQEPTPTPTSTPASLTPTQKKIEALPSKPRKSCFLTLFFSLFFALLISAGGFFLVFWSRSSFDMANIRSQIKLATTYFPFFHIHTTWGNMSWDVRAILTLVLLVAGPLLAGWWGSNLGKRRGLGCSLFFGILYAGLCFAAQIGVLKLRLDAWRSLYSMLGLSLQPEYANAAVCLIYMIFVAFVLHWLGSRLAKKG